MINLDSFKEFKNHKKTLKAISKDNANNENMTELEVEIIDFDAVKDEYLKS